MTKPAKTVRVIVYKDSKWPYYDIECDRPGVSPGAYHGFANLPADVVERFLRAQDEMQQAENALVQAAIDAGGCGDVGA